MEDSFRMTPPMEGKSVASPPMEDKPMTKLDNFLYLAR